jgi:hypothetical protein
LSVSMACDDVDVLLMLSASSGQSGSG